MHDVINNVYEKTIKCLDKGFVTLIDVMPRLVPEETKTADFAIVQAARVSYGQGTKTVNEDRGLIRYLMRHAHSTPFEMCSFKFHCKMPLFIARQWIRHRTFSVNEVSGRYSVIEDDFYIPTIDNIRQQSKANKQGGEEQIQSSVATNFRDTLEEICLDTYNNYQKFIDAGISREQARMLLPVNIYTSWYWSGNLHNLLHFLALRCDSHAQWEMRQYAEAILKLIEPIVPITIEAWNDYHPMRGAMKLTKLEVEALLNRMPESSCINIDSDNEREKLEWAEKAKNIGFEITKER